MVQVKLFRELITKMISTSSDILDYLSTPLCKSKEEQFINLIKEIESLEEKLSHSNSLNWSELAKKRIMSSNTMMSTSLEELSKWDAANVFVSDKIQNNIDFDISTMGQINSIFIGKETIYRSGKIFGGGKEFIEQEYLNEAIGLFQELVINNKDLSTFKKAFHVYQWIVSLHLFEDGNGRTSRLCADYFLFKEGKLPICFETSMLSHCAQTLNSRVMNKEDAYIRFLKAIKRSYNILYTT